MPVSAVIHDTEHLRHVRETLSEIVEGEHTDNPYKLNRLELDVLRLAGGILHQIFMAQKYGREVYEGAQSINTRSIPFHDEQ